MYRKKIPFSSKDSIAGSVRGMKGCRKGAGRAITFILAGILAAEPAQDGVQQEMYLTGILAETMKQQVAKRASKRQRELLKRIQSNLKTARQRTRIS